MSIFESASRLKIRFDTVKGAITAEDLWDLPLSSTVGRVNLDDIARGLHKQLKSGDDVSFVNPETKVNERAKLAFDVVKHVIDTKMAEAAAAKEKADRADRKQKIMQLIADKQDEALRGKSADELQKMLAEL